MRSRSAWPFALLAVLVLLLFALQLFVGSIPIPASTIVRSLFQLSTVDPGDSSIVLGIRLPQAITALLAGSGLAACGLLMQTLFRNPLAGPSVLGISSGASLGVAVVLLAQPLWAVLPLPSDAVLVLAALAGAMGVLVLIILADRRVGDGITLLIVGLLVGYLCSAVIDILQARTSATALKGYVLWGMGSFGGVANERLLWLAMPVLIGLVLAILSIKPLNALLLGDDLATSLGTPVRSARRRLMWTTGIMAGTITAFCGPIAFIGLVTPHVARALLRTSDHARLLPATILCGAAMALGCDLLARAFGGTSVPLNAVTSLLGAPVVAWVLFSGKRWARSA
ncbi:MAG: iron ABC transporter permease [Flavobacteriales bacterium]|nr:iron ABC transporter permease [Flavobacteriales bacterium]